jgi:hypothetical protein
MEDESKLLLLLLLLLILLRIFHHGEEQTGNPRALDGKWAVLKFASANSMFRTMFKIICGDLSADTRLNESCTIALVLSSGVWLKQEYRNVLLYSTKKRREGLNNCAHT